MKRTYEKVTKDLLDEDNQFLMAMVNDLRVMADTIYWEFNPINETENKEMIEIMNKLKNVADEILHVHTSHYYHEPLEFIYEDRPIGGAGLND